MCRMDRSEKYLESYPDVFADIYNVLLYGRDVIKPDRLVQGPTEAVYKAETGDMREQRRDTASYYMNEDGIAALLGIENQTEVDNDMPIRVMGYDYASYRTQIDGDGRERYPVITIVLNFGDKRRMCPLSLRDSLKQESFDDMDNGDIDSCALQDYEIYVYDVAYLPDEVIEQFKSDFRIVASFFSGKERGNYVPSEDEIEHVEAVLNLLRVFTNDERYGEIEADMIEKKKRGEGVRMCTVIDTYMEKGRQQGIKQGGVTALKKIGYTPEEISAVLDMPVEDIEKLLDEE